MREPCTAATRATSRSSALPGRELRGRGQRGRVRDQAREQCAGALAQSAQRIAALEHE